MKLKKPRPQCAVCGEECARIGQTYCSNLCQRSYQTSLLVQEWLSGKDYKASRPFMRNYLIAVHHGACSQCGWNKTHPATGDCLLEMHHVNGNHKDNMPSNLVILCPNCHALTPNFRNRNRGNGRAMRRQKYAALAQ